MENQIFKNKTTRYKIPKTISVWICDFILDKTTPEYHDEWNLYSKNKILQGHTLPATDLLKYTFIELPKFNKPLESLESDEDRWMHAFCHMSKEHQIPEMLGETFYKIYNESRVDLHSPDFLSQLVTQAEINERLKEGLLEGKREMAKTPHQV